MPPGGRNAASEARGQCNWKLNCGRGDGRPKSFIRPSFRLGKVVVIPLAPADCVLLSGAHGRRTALEEGEETHFLCQGRRIRVCYWIRTLTMTGAYCHQRLDSPIAVQGQQGLVDSIVEEILFWVMAT